MCDLIVSLNLYRFGGHCCEEKFLWRKDRGAEGRKGR
jgi:hypothetical protein